MPNHDRARHISNCLELAILLEVSAAKPGNVNLTSGFQDTRIEHFLASAVAAKSSLEEAAKRGIAVKERKLRTNEVGMGQIVKDCIANINAWQKGGNTLLGTVILFVPIAVAAGMIDNDTKWGLKPMRENLRLAVESTTAEDAINLYKAMDVAKPSGLGRAPDLDVNYPKSKKRILEENISLLEVFKIAADYDSICFEWVNNYPITFDLAYPNLLKQLERRSLNQAIVQTFLKVLSKHPDTLIARKVGIEKAHEISSDAQRILDFGGLETMKGKKLVMQLDKKLRKSGNLLNPGTTADITAAALALCILKGYRP